jgi:hypothetical protein
MTVKSLLVKVGVDLSEFNAGMDRMSASVEKNAKTFKDVGLVMTGVGGIISAFFGKAVKDAAAAEAAHAKLANSLKAEGDGAQAAADRLAKYADAMQNVTGIDNDEIVNAQALLGTYGLTEKQIMALTPRLLDMAVAHATATGSEVDLTGAARALGMAVNGNAAQLTRHGVAISENTKLTGSFNSILKDLDKSVGGASTAFGKTFAGQMKIANAQIADAFKAIGGLLLPILTPLIKAVADAAKGVLAWTDSHKELMKILVPVAAGIGAVLLVTGPLVAVFPKIVAGVASVGKAFVFLATNPIVLLAAAAVGLYLILKKVQEAEDQLAQADDRLAAKEKVTRDRLMAAADAAGMSRREMIGLIEKYHGYVGALEMAINKGQEGDALQKALHDSTRKSSAAYEEYEKNLKKTAVASGDLSAAQQELQDKILKMRETLTADFMKLTLTEVAQAKWAANQEYQDRVKELGKLKAANAGYDRDVQMAAKIRDAKLFEIEFQYSVKLLQQEQKTYAQKRKNEAASVLFVQDILNQEREKRTAFATARLELEHKTFAAQLVQLAAERDAKLASIAFDLTKTKEEKTTLMAEWEQYYKDKKDLIEEDRKAAEEGFNAIMVGGTESIKSLTENTMLAFQSWGDGTKSLLGVIGEAFNAMASMALSAISKAVSAELTGSATEIAASRATAIGRVIASVMALPFPLNVAAVGGAIALVSALFKAIHFAEGGIVTRPTLALIGEAGPEAVIPLRGAGRGGPVPALAGMGGQIRITANFYGDIRSDKDIDRMSKAMADQVNKAMRHRRV